MRERLKRNNTCLSEVISKTFPCDKIPYSEAQVSPLAQAYPLPMLKREVKKACEEKFQGKKNKNK